MISRGVVGEAASVGKWCPWEAARVGERGKGRNLGLMNLGG